MAISDALVHTVLATNQEVFMSTTLCQSTVPQGPVFDELSVLAYEPEAFRVPPGTEMGC
jgi:hypothetical protein